ncbi:unnamed protein product [Cylindrotheca closterium]|uniref:Uncharacterized protein n=1 Tax=Cylindrotheca closterium TaxID=2856 RepID=A0AAD2CDZ0_9STRA|nr:unnamed protein product [Cylindrotheca closterium]
MTGEGKQAESKFAKHAESDSALAPEKQSEEVPKRKKGMAIAVFPCIVGGISLTIAIIEQRRNSDYELNIDRDFMYPFVLALCLTMVVGFQTKGFTKDKPEPLVSWPKVKKQRKVVHKYVVKGKEEEEEQSDKKND